jgi:hypothetical protein
VRRSIGVWIGAAVSALLFGYLLAFGASNAAVMFMAILASLMFAGVAFAMRTPADAAWIFKWVTIGFLAKLAGTWARHFMVTGFYGGGDSYRYYRAGVELALQWRSGEIPDLTGSGSLATQVIEAITGAIFAVFTPNMLGGFLMFSIVAFFGQLMLYAAFRHWAKPHQLKPYAILIFLLPTFNFWPSSIGKDAVVMFLLGGSAYFAARTLDGFRFVHILGLAAFLYPLSLIRIHIAGLLVVGLLGASLLAKFPKSSAAVGDRIRRFAFIGVALAAGAFVIATVPDVLGVDLAGEDSIDEFASDVVRRTSDGTIAEGEPVNGVEDVPGAVALVLFRPVIFEAEQIQHTYAAIETAAISIMTLWLLPRLVANLRYWRRNPYIVFCTVYTVAYSVAFSIVRNLGIIARQRGQVLAFFLAFLRGLGWEQKDPDRDLHPAFREGDEERTLTDWSHLRSSRGRHLIAKGPQSPL